MTTLRALRLTAPVLLLAALFVPFLLLGRPQLLTDGDLGENRARNVLPGVPRDLGQYRTLTRRFDDWVFDNFGLRDLLIENNAALRYEVFSSSTHRRVLVGRDGWLYQKDTLSLRDLFGATPLPVRELRNWRVLFEERRDWLAERGAGFLVAVAPRKQSIYPEYLPAQYRNPGGISALQQFADYLQGRSNLRFVDLRQPLLAARAGREVYFRTDSHWNYHGGLAGYRAIAERLPEYFDPASILDGATVSAERIAYRTNLPRMMGVELREPVERLTPRAGARAHRLPPRVVQREIRYFLPATEVFEVDDPSLPRGILFADSFAGWDSEFLAEHFRKLVVINLWGKDSKHSDGLPLPVIESVDPDVVIMQFVEGHLGTCAANQCIGKPGRIANRPPVRQARLRALFGSAAAGARTFALASQEPLVRRVAARPGAAQPAVHRLVFRGAAAIASGPLIVRARLESAGAGKLKSVIGARDACTVNLEVVSVALEPGANDVLVCHAGAVAGAELVLYFVGVAPGAVTGTLETVSHPDLLLEDS